jgi:SAM-dependent methyltransferase
VNPADSNALARRNAVAWDRTASKYAADIDADVALLQAGGTSLLQPELRVLGPLLGQGGRAIHLQCSHGLDTLSLWRLGASAVVGLDFSERMLAIAEQKSGRLGAPARWVHADVLHPPDELTGTADLVYTGKGALPWIRDLEQWAAVITQLLVPGGRFFLFEGHPLNWVWDTDARHVRLREDASYFATSPRANTDFPGRYLQRLSSDAGQERAEAIEWQWTLGDILSTLIASGLVLEEVREHAEHFWPQFDAVAHAELARLPHTFSALMRRPA